LRENPVSKAEAAHAACGQYGATIHLLAVESLAEQTSLEAWLPPYKGTSLFGML